MDVIGIPRAAFVDDDLGDPRRAADAAHIGRLKESAAGNEGVPGQHPDAAAHGFRVQDQIPAGHDGGALNEPQDRASAAGIAVCDQRRASSDGGVVDASAGNYDGSAVDDRVGG